MNKCKDCDNSFQRRNIIRYTYYNYRYSAKKRGYEFFLTYNEFASFSGKPCEYCDLKLDKVRLDRVDNSKGYYTKNVVSCCKRCNSLKRGIPADFILRVAKAISNFC